MEERQYNRAEEDLGNIVEIGHVNTAVPRQRLATLFYVTGLGLTRDPYVNTSTHNMWINVGKSQFHLPTTGPEILRGVTGLVMPDRAGLVERLTRMKKPLDGTRFDFREAEDRVETICPWGNRIHCHFPDRDRFGPTALGMAYIAFDVQPGTAKGIARFYGEILGAAADVIEDAQGRAARVMTGAQQYFYFRETDAPEAPYDGHHIQVYVQNFSGPHRRLKELGLVFQESSQHQYRFKDVIDLDTKKVLFTVDHEIRSMQHPFYGRPLVNRNPAITVQNYRPGHDSIAWAVD